MRWLIMIFLLTLTACASDLAAMKARSIESSNADFKAAVPCCNKFTELQYAEMSSKKELLTLDSFSPVFEFATGKSFVAAIVLPDFQTGDSLRVKSLVIGEGAFIPATVLLLPLATFLDAQKEGIETTEVEFIDYHSGLFSDTEGGAFGIVEIPHGSKYVVFHTAESFFGKTFEF